VDLLVAPERFVGNLGRVRAVQRLVGVVTILHALNRFGDVVCV
jgi:hypothetical protein